TKDSRKGAHPRAVEHLVVAIEIASLQTLHQTIKLILGKEVTTQQRPLKLLQRDRMSPEFAPQSLEVVVINHTHIERTLSELFGSLNITHSANVPPMAAR